MDFYSGTLQLADVPQAGQRRASSLKAIAKEILRLSSPVSLAPPAPFDEASILVPDSRETEKELSRLVGLCDIIFRTAGARDNSLDTSWPASWPREGAAVSRSSFFEEACACYRPAQSWCHPPTDFFAAPLAPNSVLEGTLSDVPLGDLADIPIEDDGDHFTFDFDAFTAAARGMMIPEDAYGVAGGVVRLKLSAALKFNSVTSSTRRIALEILRRANSLIGERSISSEASAVHLVDEFMKTLPSESEAVSMWQRIEARAATLGSAWSMVKMLRARVEKHIAKRMERDQHYLEQMSDDAFATMARHLGSTAASSLMRTSRAFCGMETLRDRLPHIRIRHVDGIFPHGRILSRDRADIANGVDKPVMRAFVVKRNAVRIYVDFIVNVLRKKPLAKLPRKDGLCNRYHDFDDDEYEEAPERVVHRGPQPAPMYVDFGAAADRQALIYKRHRDAWILGEGPWEPLDRFSFDRRVPYTSYFRAPLVMVPSLVFADDHSLVPSAEHKGGLALSINTRARGGTFSQPKPRDVSYSFDYTHPASIKFHVAALSRDYNDRMFKIKVVARGELKDGMPYKCTIYSEAFESVGRRDAVSNAAKRGSANARERKSKAPRL